MTYFNLINSQLLVVIRWVLYGQFSVLVDLLVNWHKIKIQHVKCK